MARILVIEDNEGLRRLVQRMLHEGGHEVLLTSESTDALRLWQSREIETLQPTLPIIVISGRGREELLDLITGAGLMSSVRWTACHRVRAASHARRTWKRLAMQSRSFSAA